MRKYLGTIKVKLFHIMRALKRIVTAALVAIGGWTMRRRRLAIMGILAIVLVGAIMGWQLSRPILPEHPPIGVKIAHAAVGDKKGCATCHAAAIPYTTCSGSKCHAALVAPFTITPTTVLINLPHHNEAFNPTGGPNACSSCHGGGTDARYVTIPTANHTATCGTCHARTHSTP